VQDIRNEANARLQAFIDSTDPIPPHPNYPIPETDEDDMATFIIRNSDTGQVVLLAYDGAGVTATGLAFDDLGPYQERFGNWLDTDPSVFDDFIAKSNEG
jgi:hypothetical protein